MAHTDANGAGGEFNHWVGQTVETEFGIGKVVRDMGDEINVNHTFPTHDTEQGTYAKAEVYIVEDSANHPANTSLRSHEFDELRVMDEPKLHYYD